MLYLGGNGMWDVDVPLNCALNGFGDFWITVLMLILDLDHKVLCNRTDTPHAFGGILGLDPTLLSTRAERTLMIEAARLQVLLDEIEEQAEETEIEQVFVD